MDILYVPINGAINKVRLRNEMGDGTQTAVVAGSKDDLGLPLVQGEP